MIRTIYKFNNKDYEKFDKLTLNFIVANSNIESFIKELNLFKLNKNGVGYTIEKESTDRIVINTKRESKIITLTLSAVFMCEKLFELGFQPHSEILDNINIYRYRFDKSIAN